MIRLGVIFGLLFQSLVAICCGNLLSPKADGCCGTTTPECCCCAQEDARAASGCCSDGETDACCEDSQPASLPADCKCCVVSPDNPQAPADPSRRYTGDTDGVAVAPDFAPIPLPVSREPSSLALWHDPPWPSGRALLADQCRWNL